MVASCCTDWSLPTFNLSRAFSGVQSKIAADPAKPFFSAFGQMANFLGTPQNVSVLASRILVS